MIWSNEQTEKVMSVALRCWPSFKADQVAQLLRSLRERHLPHVVSKALEDLYSTQERPRRPGPREVETHIAGSADAPRTGRIAAYREMEEFDRGLGSSVLRVGIRGQSWEVCSSALWNSTGAIPMGDITPQELDVVMRAYRELRRQRRVAPEVPA